MASYKVCRSCLRSLRAQHTQFLEQRCTSTGTSIRTITSSARRAQEPAPRANTPSVSDMQKHLRGTTAPKSTTQSIAERIRKSAPQTAETYHAYGATEHYISAINEIVGYDIPQVRAKEEVPKLEGGEDLGVAVGEGEWYRELALQPTFNNWAQLAMLHLYILVTRIRCLPTATAKTWSQHITDHFFRECEERMDTLHSITARGVRSKYLKDLFLQWRGVLVSYDEGLVKGDAVLAAAVWRNVLGGKEDVDPVRLAMIVAWMRREVARVAQEGDPMMWSRFRGLRSEEPVVLMKSHYMDKPLTMDPTAGDATSRTKA